MQNYVYFAVKKIRLMHSYHGLDKNKLKAIKVSVWLFVFALCYSLVFVRV
jgi:hypothetical protein